MDQILPLGLRNISTSDLLNELVQAEPSSQMGQAQAQGATVVEVEAEKDPLVHLHSYLGLAYHPQVSLYK